MEVNLILSLFKGFGSGLFLVTPILFSFMYAVTALENENRNFLSDDGLSIKEFYFSKSEEVTMFGHILWLIIMFYPFILINYIARSIAFILTKLFIKD